MGGQRPRLLPQTRPPRPPPSHSTLRACLRCACRHPPHTHRALCRGVAPGAASRRVRRTGAKPVSTAGIEGGGCVTTGLNVSNWGARTRAHAAARGGRGATPRFDRRRVRAGGELGRSALCRQALCGVCLCAWARDARARERRMGQAALGPRFVFELCSLLFDSAKHNSSRGPRVFLPHRLPTPPHTPSQCRVARGFALSRAPWARPAAALRPRPRSSARGRWHRWLAVVSWLR